VSVLAKIEARDFASLRAESYALMKLVTFHCAECDACYCANCWAFDAPVYEDGSYIYTPGTCPRKHGQPMFE